jgi:catechol 2,3-dioxygenase-like lactoylglutathione lyase family enzyme
MSHDLPLANIITLGVSDVAGERDFYRRLGWPLVLDTDDFVSSSFAARCSPCSARTTWAETPTPSPSAAAAASAARSSSRPPGPGTWTS